MNVVSFLTRNAQEWIVSLFGTLKDRLKKSKGNLHKIPCYTEPLGKEIRRFTKVDYQNKRKVKKNVSFFYPIVLQLLIGACGANGCLPLAEFSEDSEFCDCSIVRPADRVAMKDLIGPMQDLIEF